MKKLSFVLCFAFMAGVVFAQNSSTVTQTGLINNASIVQAGSSTAILSQETLSGARNNNATISQTGAGNTVSSGQVQGAGIASAQNLSATQSGIGNVALQTQASSYIGYNNATIEQLDNANIGSQTQNGYNLSATIDQSGGVFNSSGNNGLQIQTGGNLNATITQRGGINFGTQTQSGTNNSATITSTGDRNQATQTQGSIITQTGGPNLTSTIEQNGSDNIASQTATGYDNLTSIIQQGDFNRSTQTVDGSFNNSRLYQTNGTVNLSQSGISNVIKGLTNASVSDLWAKFSGLNLGVSQTGTNNSVALEADGIVDINQDNSGSSIGNIIEFSQVGGGASVSNLHQSGTANLVKLNKTGDGRSDIAQTGNANKVALIDGIFGATPTVVGTAAFNGAALDIIQTGELNLINLNSTSPGDVVNVSQVGSFNNTSIIQSL